MSSAFWVLKEQNDEENGTHQGENVHYFQEDLEADALVGGCRE